MNAEPIYNPDPKLTIDPIYGRRDRLTVSDFSRGDPVVMYRLFSGMIRLECPGPGRPRYVEGLEVAA